MKENRQNSIYTFSYLSFAVIQTKEKREMYTPMRKCNFMGGP